VRILSTVLLLSACSHSESGPPLSLQSLTPDLVCGAQHPSLVTLTGSGLSPLVGPVLGTPQVRLPQVSIKRTKDLSGGTAGETLPIPDDAAHPELADVAWQSSSALAVTLCPPGTCSAAMAPLTDLSSLPSGLYDVGVQSTLSETATLPSALGVVDPPTVQRIEPDLNCQDVAAPLTVTGDFLLQLASGAPTVELDAIPANGTPISMPLAITDCRTPSLPPAEMAQICTRGTFTIPAGMLRKTTVALAVHNPAPADCSFTQGIKPNITITFVPSPTVSAVMPTTVSRTVPKPVTVTGTEFLQIDGVRPTLMLGTNAVMPSQMLGCVAAPAQGQREVVLSCTQLLFTLAVNQLPVGSYKVTVVNPAPAGCTTPTSVTLVIGP
jgi:hypothetical protein